MLWLKFIECCARLRRALNTRRVLCLSVGLSLCLVASMGWGQTKKKRVKAVKPVAMAKSKVKSAHKNARYVLSQGEALLSPVDVARLRLQRAHIQAVSQGRRVVKIELRCDLKLCRNPVAAERFKDIAGLFVGMTYDRQKMDVARNRLLKTGFFHNDLAIKSTVVNPQSVRLDIYMRGATLIRHITFKGVSPPPFREDLRKVLIYREGRPYTGDPEKERVQLRSFIELYNKEGYFDTTVKMSIERDKKNPRVVDLTFTIKKGEELRICKMGIRGATVFTYDEARDMLLTNIPLLERRLNLVLPRYTSRALREGQSALIKAYRKKGYFQARLVNKRIKFKNKKGCVEVLIDIVEGPKWKIEFKDTYAFKEKELMEKLPFFETGYVDRQGIEQAENIISKLYMTRGYAFAQVKGKEIRRDRFSRRLIFQIKENQKVEIRKIVFYRKKTSLTDRTRPKELTDEGLQNIMGTRPFGLFATGGFLQYEELLSDFVNIERQYRQLGYLKATVNSFAVELIEQGKALKIHISIEEGPRTTVNRLEFEGNRRLPTGTLKQLIDIRPDPKKKRNTNAFIPLQLKADASRIVQRYAAMGYPMAKVETRCYLPSGKRVACALPTRPDRCTVRSSSQLYDFKTPVTIKGSALPVRLPTNPKYQAVCRWRTKPRPIRECRRLKIDKQCVFGGGANEQSVRVVHRIKEGPFVRVGEILLKGNFDTQRELIFRELELRTGDPFNVKKLLGGQANLRSLGLFDSVSVEAIGLDDSAAQSEQTTAAIIISVEEGNYQYVDSRVGLQGRDLLNDSLRRLIVIGEAEYNNRNLWGLGQRFTPRLLLAADTLQLLGFGVNANTDTFTERLNRVDYLVGAELIYRDPRFLKSLFDLDRLLLTISPYYLLDLIGVSNNLLQREEAGVRSEVRKELVELVERLFLTFGVEAKWIATRSPDTGATLPNGKPLFSPRRTIAKMFVELAFDRRDSALNPSKGYYLEFTPQWVSGNASEGVATAAIDDSFLRLTFAGSFYVPLWGRSLIFGQSFRYGQIVPVNNRERPVPDDERYVLGGVSSVRGFPEAGISTSTTGGINQLRGGEFTLGTNSEFRYPLLGDMGLYAATFFDVGLLVDCFDDQATSQRTSCYGDAFPVSERFSKIRYSTGVGVRYLIVDQIPLLLDYAILLNRKPGESFSYLHFNVGYSF